MVLQPAHAGAANAGGWILATPLQGKPDINRVAGITGTLVLNAAAFMLLLVPLSSPPPMALQEREMEMYWVDAPKPPTPPPPTLEKITPATPAPVVPATQQKPVERPVVVDTPVFATAELPVEAVVADTPPTMAVADPGPPVAVGSSLQYTDAPAPPYPRSALMDGREGTVVLRVTVGVDGRPTAVTIEHSSGHRDFDEAARRQVLRRWSFRPAVVDGQAVEAVGLVPIDFRLG